MTSKNLSLEEEFKKLEEIVAEFESGKKGLEQSLESFKEAVQLSKNIKRRLSKLQNEVSQIQKDVTIESENQAS